ncbi:leucyl aminopeptidase [bacterium]|nr:MAG: leucyl aminopeptidase [bacterium]
MKITVRQGALAQTRADALVVGVHAGVKKLSAENAAVDKACNGAIREALGYGDFKAGLGQCVFVPAGKAPAKRVLVVGLGKRKGFDAAGSRKAAAAAARACRKARLKSLAFAATDEATTDAMAEGLGMANYDAGLHLTRDADKRPLQLTSAIFCVDGALASVRKRVARGLGLAAGVNFSRDLVNEPSNCMTPTIMANRAKALAREFPTIGCRVWGPREIEKNKMGGLMGVGRGSTEPSQFIHLEYKPKGAGRGLKKIAFVGKGVTFDSGGISIKPSAGMELMKFDMGGAAAVLGAFKILGALQPKVHVLGYIAAAENMPDGSAIKPGDLLTMMNGLTVEVNNTDAEGRLVLGDALHYAKSRKPEFIVDAATLTGACMIALGDAACGLMSEDDKLVKLIEGAGKASGDPVWRLPLQDRHRKLMKGHVADLKNTGPREGGALTAAGFLSNFTVGARWAHLDIAGVVWNDPGTALNPKGGTGFGARLFAAIAEAAAE